MADSSSISLDSTAIAHAVSVDMVTPTTSRHPDVVVYALHGTGGEGSNWRQFVPLGEIADQYGVVFICPSLGNAWARVDPLGRDWLHLLTHELPTAVESKYELSVAAENRWIVGISAGGYNALRCAFQCPGVFDRCGAFSPGGLLIDTYLDYLRPQPRATMENPHLLDVFGDDLRYRSDDVLLNLAREAVGKIPRANLFISMGAEDDLKTPCDTFIAALKAMHYPLAYRVSAGSHDWSFWQRSLLALLDEYLPG